MLERDKTALIVVDVQGKLADLMSEREALFANVERLIGGARAMGLPIVVTEQNPEKLGATRPEIAACLGDYEPITKMTFSCCGEPAFPAAVKGLGKPKLLVAGIETHVCVYQTVRDLLLAGYEVHVAADAVSSRAAANRQIALDRMRSEGAVLTSTEMALMELLQVAGTEEFRQVLKLIR